MRIQTISIVPACFSIVIGLCHLSCKKLVTVPQPINSITSTEEFNTDAQANTAMAGIYTSMVNGRLSYSNGYTTILGGMSADELFYYGTSDPIMMTFPINQVVMSNSYTGTMWSTAYKAIYNANAVIEGIAASTSGLLHDSARQRLTAEAKFVRAFSYFYLVNLFGDVPLVQTVDFNKVRYMARTPVNDVYGQIIQDLKDAQSVLTPDSAKERILPNKWAATALLARVYLYKSDYENAAAQATAVISNTAMYKLETDPNAVFLNNSREAIWQLKQGTNDANYKNATIEGFSLLPNPLATAKASYCLTTSLLNAFEAGDKRRTAWVNSTNFGGAGLNYYPYKYKAGQANFSTSAPTEYYMVFRLAEMYLVRAEATANGAAGGTAAAITDLNTIRSRAGLTALSSSLTQAQVITAVAKERQVELFAEWGHRWFDLKRTGKAHDVLSALSWKQPWSGDYQLLYPIPPAEITTDPFLQQNPDYIQ